MLKRSSLFWVTVILLICLVPATLFGRASLGVANVKGNGPGLSTANPNYCTTQHSVGRIVLGIGNYGVFGGGDGFVLGSAVDCFTGTKVLSCEFPKGNRSSYLYSAAFWVGAVVGRDTLVSMGADGWLGRQTFHPDEGTFGEMLRRSIMDPTSKEFKGAVSEQDFIAIYSDTFTSGVGGMDIDEIDQTSHVPLGIRVNQNSYAWSYPYAEDFVLFDYSITNIGDNRLRQVYMGIYVDADVNNQGEDDGFDDDICGFLETMNTSYGGGDWIDTINIAWIADGSGGLGQTNKNPVPHVTATRIVRTPSDSLQVSFNWWISNGDASFDFGPQHKKTFRELSTGGTGTPAGVRNKYAFLKNGEFDYDQVYTKGISPADTLWSYPNQSLVDDFSDGFDTRYLLSFGPFNIDPGQTLPLSLAYLAGENLHVEKDNLKDNIQNNAAYDPDLFNETLDFSDLALNSVWASFIYDNPGVDTDSDGYFGEYRLACNDTLRLIDTLYDTIWADTIIVSIDSTIDTTWEFNFCDTVWYVGDGVPDFRGASPPPPPKMWITPSPGRLHVRWNGLRSETTKDVFSREYDFEGYRVYLGLDNREDSYSLLASFDREDYNKWVFNAGKAEWELLESPFTIDQLRCIYGESCDDQSFAPERFTESSPYFLPGTDSIFYFEPQDYNRSVLGVTTPIRKIYPNQPYPSSILPEEADASELTADGHLKYFEYEYWVENLLSTIPYYVTVTAFDYGSPPDLASLETSKSINETEAFATASAGDVISDGLEVFVYPNPYIGDGRYASVGLEGRGFEYDNPPAERIRALHFANLPPKCTISIFSIDGDLIRTFEHDENPSDPTSGHDSWDMVTRNTQAIVSGIYYWTVEDADGNTQIGKFVIIL